MTKKVEIEEKRRDIIKKAFLEGKWQEYYFLWFNNFMGYPEFAKPTILDVFEDEQGKFVAMQAEDGELGMLVHYKRSGNIFVFNVEQMRKYMKKLEKSISKIQSRLDYYKKVLKKAKKRV